MKTTLFKAIDAADSLSICGYEVTEVGYAEYLSPSAVVARLTTSDDVDYHFADQEVELVDGCVLANDTTEGLDEEPRQYAITLKVERRLTPADLEEQA